MKLYKTRILCLIILTFVGLFVGELIYPEPYRLYLAPSRAHAGWIAQQVAQWNFTIGLFTAGTSFLAATLLKLSRLKAFFSSVFVLLLFFILKKLRYGDFWSVVFVKESIPFAVGILIFTGIYILLSSLYNSVKEPSG